MQRSRAKSTTGRRVSTKPKTTKFQEPQHNLHEHEPQLPVLRKTTKKSHKRKTRTQDHNLKKTRMHHDPYDPIREWVVEMHEHPLQKPGVTPPQEELCVAEAEAEGHHHPCVAP